MHQISNGIALTCMNHFTRRRTVTVKFSNNRFECILGINDLRTIRVDNCNAGDVMANSNSTNRTEIYYLQISFPPQRRSNSSFARECLTLSAFDDIDNGAPRWRSSSFQLSYRPVNMYEKIFHEFRNVGWKPNVF